MAASRSHFSDIRSIGSGTLRLMLALMLAGLLVSVVATFSGAGATGPTANAGDSGGGPVSVADMLRGVYSPVFSGPELAVSEVEAPMSVSDMLRGDLSPVDVVPEIAVTEVQAPMTVAEMTRGELSPI